MRKKNTPVSISIVVPTYNEEARLPAFLSSMLSQQQKPLEVILVDGMSTDTTKNISDYFRGKFGNQGIRLIFVETKQRGITVARDIGFRKSRSRYIASCDADTVYPPEYLRLAVKWLEQHAQQGYVGVAGNPISIKDPPWFLVAERILHYIRESVLFAVAGRIVCIRAYNIVFLREAYIRSTGMNTSVYAIEDEVGLSRSLRETGRIGFSRDLVPEGSNRRMQRGVLYYLFVTILISYWGTYVWNIYSGGNIKYKKTDEK